MFRHPHEIPNYVTARHVVDYFPLTWYKFRKYRKLGTIPHHDALVNGRPVWLRKRLKELLPLINALEGR